MTMNIFEKATKKRLRFITKYGNNSVEDIWKMPLSELDELAKEYNHELENSGTSSFLRSKSKSKKENLTELRFEIVKHIINSLEDDAEKSNKAQETRAKNQLIMQIINNKENDALNELPIEELREMLSKETEEA